MLLWLYIISGRTCCSSSLFLNSSKDSRDTSIVPFTLISFPTYVLTTHSVTHTVIYEAIGLLRFHCSLQERVHIIWESLTFYSHNRIWLSSSRITKYKLGLQHWINSYIQIDEVSGSSFEICYLLSVICYLLSAVCYLLSVINEKFQSKFSVWCLWYKKNGVQKCKNV